MKYSQKLLRISEVEENEHFIVCNCRIDGTYGRRIYDSDCWISVCCVVSEILQEDQIWSFSV